MFQQISSRIYCSGEPASSESFQALAQRGIHLIVSVDGARPDVDAAAKHGIRYVHLPIGYDGVPVEAQAALKALLASTSEPLLVHCHHGKHRGPAAAAIAGMEDGALTPQSAESLLKRSGTSPDYKGLWDDVRSFRGVPDTVKAMPLVSVAEVKPLAAEMSRIDRAFEQLEPLWDKAEALAQQRNLATIVAEGFRESARLVRQDSKTAPELLELLEKSSTSAREFAEALQTNGKGAESKSHLAAIKQDCKGCHTKFRN